MDSQKKYSNNHGRKPKTDKMRHRYVFRLSDGDNARFLALFDESGKATRAEFIVSALFGREIKVVKLDNGTQDFYMRLTSFHSHPLSFNEGKVNRYNNARFPQVAVR